jgi:hypothetical protein
MRLIPHISQWFARFLSFAGWSRGTSKEAKFATEIICTLPDGRQLTMEELHGLTGSVNFREGKLLEVTGKVRYEIMGTGGVPAEAKSLHERAREAGGRGDYKTAIALENRSVGLYSTRTQPE